MGASKTVVRLAFCSAALLACADAAAQWQYCMRDVTRPFQRGCDSVAPAARPAQPVQYYWEAAPVPPPAAYYPPPPATYYPPPPLTHYPPPPVTHYPAPYPVAYPVPHRAGGDEVAAAVVFGLLSAVLVRNFVRPTIRFDVRRR